MKAGVLALQGDFREHARMFAECGVTPILVRTTDDLASVDCLAIPGGESSAIGRLARVYGLVEPIKERIARGMPVFGTCAGMIVLARTVRGGPPLLDMLDIEHTTFGRHGAETSTMTVVPPHASGVRPRSDSSFFTSSGLAFGLSILLIATRIGTPAALA